MEAFEALRSRKDMEIARYAMLEWYAPYEQATLLGYLRDLRLAPGVREAFGRLKAEGVRTALVSITWQFAVDWLAPIWEPIMP